MCFYDSDINFQGQLRQQPGAGTWKLSLLMKEIQPENLNTSTKSNKMLVWGFLDMLSLNFPQFWTLCIHSGNCYHLMFKHMTVVIGFLIYMPGFWSKQFQDEKSKESLEAIKKLRSKA